MKYRIEVHPRLDETGIDSRGNILFEKSKKNFPAIKSIRMVDVYTLEGNISPEQLQKLGTALTQPVTQNFTVHSDNQKQKTDDLFFTYAIEIGFLPGVTDNVATTVRDIVKDLFGKIDAEIYSSRLLLLEGNLSDEDAKRFAATQHNPLIQRAHIKSASQFANDGGMDFVVPKVKLSALPVADEVDLSGSDDELTAIASKGIANKDGSRRGPLGLSLDYIKAIRDYFRDVEKRNPRDIELETLAQTWSEHCKHTIFASALDEIKDGIYKHYIRRATEEIRKRRGNNDICVSVFKDNSGAIIFDDEWLITDKVETHNSPSALDPFGGSITGIVGVNRDSLGFGMGARPVINRYGFCFADPRTNPEYYRAPGKKNKMLSPRTIMDGVIQGVNVGGNCSGIPTPQGFAYFDQRYVGKPLVYVGTVGIIPRQINGKPSHVKGAKNGDLIVMIGGRVGKDGIHGATFSSVALDEGSPSTAVQIGDPITQKKFSDAIIRDARALELYNAITDNGAGGLSSSVGEMAEGSGGFELNLDKVPLKYPGMAPWEVWISESQERMTLAVPPHNLKRFVELMESRGVEATAIGTFTSSGRAVIKWGVDTLMDMTMDFLHDGNPPKFLKSKQPAAKQSPAPAAGEICGAGEIKTTATLSPHEKSDVHRATLLTMLARPNICSKEFIATQYDHEVQGGSVLKPLQGKGRVFAEATVTRPVLSSPKAAVTSHGLAPRYSDIDTYHMAAASIDMAVRNAVAVGCSLDRLAILDNFCWCDSENPERLWQLKRAAEACYDVAVAYGTPYISGKDSMFNDFRGYDADGNQVMISAPPTLLVSGLGVIDDAVDAISLDAKLAGDLIYVIGATSDELGGSEFFDAIGQVGTNVPVLDTTTTERDYRSYHQAVKQRLIASAIAINIGGLGVTLAKTLIGGGLGAEINLDELACKTVLKPHQKLYSESLGRILVTVAPQNKTAFEKAMAGSQLSLVGSTNDSGRLVISGILSADIAELSTAYKSTFMDY